MWVGRLECALMMPGTLPEELWVFCHGNQNLFRVLWKAGHGGMCRTEVLLSSSFLVPSPKWRVLLLLPRVLLTCLLP